MQGRQPVHQFVAAVQLERHLIRQTDNPVAQNACVLVFQRHFTLLHAILIVAVRLVHVDACRGDMDDVDAVAVAEAIIALFGQRNRLIRFVTDGDDEECFHLRQVGGGGGFGDVCDFRRGSRFRCRGDFGGHRCLRCADRKLCRRICCGQGQQRRIGVYIRGCVPPQHNHQHRHNQQQRCHNQHIAPQAIPLRLRIRFLLHTRSAQSFRY